MPLLDLCQIFFDPAATIETKSSIFSKEWHMTLGYVLHQPGLDFAFTSRLSVDHEIWVFLLWKTEEARANFYHQTPGFGLLSQRMQKAPRVFFFGDAEYRGLCETKDWTVDVLCGDLGEQKSAESLSSYEFVARHEGQASERLYRGNSFGDAYVRLTRGVEQVPQGDLKWEHFPIELQKHERVSLQKRTHTDVALDIADLISKQPLEYGIVEYDDSQYADIAYPMDLSVSPMMTLGSADDFFPDAHRHLSCQPGDSGQYAMCIISLTQEANGSDPVEKDAIENLCNRFGLQNGVQGLQELSILRTTGGQTGTLANRFLCVWNNTLDFGLWRQKYASCDLCSLEFVWEVSKPGLPNLEWENLPLTPDNQTWQPVEKVLETVVFSFSQNLSPAEKEAFQQRVYALTNTMSSCWSGEIDARPVVYAEDPVWNKAQDGPSSCLLFVAWDGVAQRTAWLRNFMANGLNLTGHLAHSLGHLCHGVKSDTYSWEKVYECNANGAPSKVEGNGDTDDDSDRDMGF